MKRVCKECGEAKPRRAFYKGRWVCRRCVVARAKRIYLVRNAFREGASFVCRQCGETKPVEYMSTYADDLCKSCHSSNLLAKKAVAPDTLTCRVCGKVKSKEMFERYSITRCKECASRTIKKYGKESEDE